MGIAVTARIGVGIGSSTRRLPWIVLEWWFWWMVVTSMVGSCHGWPIQVRVRPNSKIPRIVPVSKPHDTTITWTSHVQQVLRKDQVEEPSLSPTSSMQGHVFHTILRHSTIHILGWMVMGLGTVAASSYAMDFPPTNSLQVNTPSTIAKTANVYEWELLNGSVQLPDPIRLNYRDRHTRVEQAITLTKPELVGAGGGGAVFAFDTLSQLDDNRDDRENQPQQERPSAPSTLLLKVSWEGTLKTVQRECATLQLLEDRQVQAAERCLGTLPYPSMGPGPSLRTMILVSPYMRDAVASIDEVDNPHAKKVAVDHIARNLVQMLAASVITIDVQPLISKSTGQTIFIDMTEAQTLSSSLAEPRTTNMLLQQTLISSYISEMVALIPSQYWKLAQGSISNELELINQRQEPNGPDLATALRSLLEEQTPFFENS